MFSSPGALSGATVAVLIVAFIASGSLLTLGAKLADITTSLGNEGTYHKFNHPLMQTWAMFVGETLCFMAYWICFHKSSDAIGADGADSESAQPKILSIGGEPASSAHTDSGLVAAAPTRPPAYSVWIFALPASLDLLASTLMGFALIFTYSSTYQMLRGSVVLFTALLSLLFLGRRLAGFQWTGLGILVTGLVLVGVSSVLAGVQRVQAPNPVLGNALIVCAQVIVAVQMVVEEHFLSKYQVPPMLFVGWEGVFGLAFSSALIVASYWIPGWSTGGRLEDALDAFVQIKNSPVIAACFFGSMVAVAFFNYFGLTITKCVCVPIHLASCSCFLFRAHVGVDCSFVTCIISTIALVFGPAAGTSPPPRAPWSIRCALLSFGRSRSRSAGKSFSGCSRSVSRCCCSAFSSTLAPFQCPAARRRSQRRTRPRKTRSRSTRRIAKRGPRHTLVSLQLQGEWGDCRSCWCVVKSCICFLFVFTSNKSSECKRMDICRSTCTRPQ